MAWRASWYLLYTNSNCLFVPLIKNCALFDAIVGDCIRLQPLPTLRSEPSCVPSGLRRAGPDLPASPSRQAAQLGGRADNRSQTERTACQGYWPGRLDVGLITGCRTAWLWGHPVTYWGGLAENITIGSATHSQQSASVRMFPVNLIMSVLAETSYREARLPAYSYQLQPTTTTSPHQAAGLNNQLFIRICNFQIIKNFSGLLSLPLGNLTISARTEIWKLIRKRLGDIMYYDNFPNNLLKQK